MIRAALLTLALLSPVPLGAQAAAHPSAPSGPPRLCDEAAAPPTAAPLQLASRPPALVTAASLVLPGMGQLLLSKRRWAVYAGVELAGWLVHLDRARAGRRLREDYRHVAWIAARGMTEPRQEGDWEYFEALAHWLHSGMFDLDSAREGIQPETDAASYNGAIWTLARDLYLPEGAGPDHPAYARALSYYQKRAIPPELLWDWTGKEESLALYATLIDRSDEALRTATVVLGAVVANHLLSAVDAFVASRLGAQVNISTAPTWRRLGGGAGVQWTVELRPWRQP